MRFFSGFGFRSEKLLFLEYLERGEFVIAGFSYGAQKALQETLRLIEEKRRVDKLQLLSPAFFNDLSKERKHKEIVAFAKNPQAYLNFFYKKALYPAKIDIAKFKAQPTLGELKELLLFEWKEEQLQRVQQSGVAIEVYLGTEDKIVDTTLAKRFFTPFAQVFTIKGAGHLLR